MVLFGATRSIKLEQRPSLFLVLTTLAGLVLLAGLIVLQFRRIRHERAAEKNIAENLADF
jgi:nitrate reductase gamma subunit